MYRKGLCTVRVHYSHALKYNSWRHRDCSHSFYGLNFLLFCTWSVTLAVSGFICIGSVYWGFSETRGGRKWTCGIPFIRFVFSTVHVSFCWPLSGIKVKAKLQLLVLQLCFLKAYREVEYISTHSNLNIRWKRLLNVSGLYRRVEFRTPTLKMEAASFRNVSSKNYCHMMQKPISKISLKTESLSKVKIYP